MFGKVSFSNGFISCRHKIFVFYILTSVFFISCAHVVENSENKEEEIPQKTEPESDATQGSITDVSGEGENKSSQLSFFWGTWVRMDSGEEYNFWEDKVETKYTSYSITSTNTNSIVVSGLGTFTKQSESVIVNNNIPYFRNCGTNLEYSLKIVGFQKNIKGIKAIGQSNKYHSWKSECESDSDGVIVLTAPTSTDLQTVTLDKGDGTTIEVSGIQVNNSGSYLGTIALVDEDQYNLKITGQIDDSETNNGYIFGNNAKCYPLKLTITNISENTCSSSICKIESKDSRLFVSSSSYNLQAFAISTMKAGGTKTLTVNV